MPAVLADVPLDTLVPRLLTVAGITITSRRLLTRWRAVQTLVPPVHLAEAPPAPPVKAADEKPSVWQRVKKNKCTTFTLVFSSILLLEFAVAYLLPKYGTRLALDLFWGTIEALLFTLVFYNALEVAFPRAIELSYTRPKADGPYITSKRQIHTLEDGLMARNPVRIALAATLTAACYAGAMTGHYWVLGTMSAAWVMMMLHNMTYPKQNTKWVVIGIMSYVGLLVGVCAIVFAIIAIVDKVKSKSPGTPSEPEADKDDKSDMATPSDWLLRIMLLMNDVWGFMMPSLLIALNLRFDLRHEPGLGGTRTSVEVPTSEPVGPRAPLFTTSLILLATCELAVSLLPKLLAETLGVMNGIVITVPVVCVGTALAAWRRGELAEWWAYKETWVPAAPKVEDVIPSDESEKAPNAGEEELGLTMQMEPEKKVTMVSSGRFNFL